jgi:hypothetical protein
MSLLPLPTRLWTLSQLHQNVVDWEGETVAKPYEAAEASSFPKVR